ncbi:MAG: MFS transporter [Lachnospiraceae bacterium]|nr:MFS transporter [Lachnospiraceae bacterium]
MLFTEIRKIDSLDAKNFLDGLVFFAPVALLIRTMAGVTFRQFFFLQAMLSFVILVSEIPAGAFTDRFGFKNTIVLNQIMLFAARLLLYFAFLEKSFPLFFLEAIVEGIAISLESGTESAYVYTMFPNHCYVIKMAHIQNCGTFGFIISTISYSLIYSLFNMKGLLFATVVTSFLGIVVSFKIPKEIVVKKREHGNHFSQKKLFAGLFQKKILLIVLMLSMISIGRILVNFLYADKLLACGVREEWMSLIILGYSVVELFAEKILLYIQRKGYPFYFAVSFAVSGVSMIAFGVFDRIGPVIGLMLFIPLLLDLPFYVLGEVQNKVIDSLGQEDRRAETLSIFNMSINIFEIIFLFTASAISRLDTTMCFAGIGGLMILTGLLTREKV